MKLKGILNLINVSILASSRVGKGIIDLFYSESKYKAPIVFAFKDKIPCNLTDLQGLFCDVVIKEDKDKNGNDRYYIFVYGKSDNSDCQDTVTLAVVDEKRTTVGSTVIYDKEDAVFKIKASSRGGNHWCYFLIFVNKPMIEGTRVSKKLKVERISL